MVFRAVNISGEKVSSYCNETQGTGQPVGPRICIQYS
jgi:hypothetical protein